MALTAESIPMRWPAGPLDIARREKTKGFTAATAEVLRKWLDPATLAIVQVAGQLPCGQLGLGPVGRRRPAEALSR